MTEPAQEFSSTQNPSARGQEYYQTLFDFAPNGYLITDEDSLIKQTNYVAADMLKIDPRFLVGKPLTVFPIQEQQAEFRKRLLQLCRERNMQHWEFCVQPRQGLPIDVELTVMFAPAQEQDAPTLWWVLRDITQSKKFHNQLEDRNRQLARLNEQLRRERERLQIMSRQVISIQEQERADIARELHDEMGQLLTGVKLLLERAIQMELPDSPRKLNDSLFLVQQLIGQVRNLSLNLHPPMLDDLGLLPTLLWHFERYTAQTDIKVQFGRTGANMRLAREIELSAYRIVQEALTNVARHAHCDSVLVYLVVQHDKLRILIQDKGVGFDVEETQIRYRSSGLTSIRERARMLGGKVSINSSPGNGTRVNIQLPLVVTRGDYDQDNSR